VALARPGRVTRHRADGKEVGVASGWRIRHKLTLGLGLVVAIMALLLSGTSRGLWSYYDTTSRIRAKLAEKEAADDFRTTVHDLVARYTVFQYIEDRPQKHLLPDRLKKSRIKLDTYEEKLEETLAHGRGACAGEFEQQMIEQLRDDLVLFEKAVLVQRGLFEGIQPNEGSENNFEEAAWKALGGDTEESEKTARKELRTKTTPIGNLRTHTALLCNNIKGELNDHLGESRRHYQVALWIIVPSSIIGLVIMGGLMLSFYAWVFNPIRDLEVGVGRVARGDLSHRIELRSGDEMEDLAIAFNDMMSRLQDLYRDLARQVNERSRQLVRSEQLASVGFLAAGVAHEINNPLASIAFCAEALEARLGELVRQLRGMGRAQEEHDVFAKYLKMIQEEAFRCKNITERLLAFSRTNERKRDLVDLCELVQSVLDVTQHLQNHKGKHITFDVSPDRGGGKIAAWVNGDEIKQVVLNLVVNALDSTDEGGRLTIQLTQRDGMAELVFTDTGCGMTQEVLDNIFEPFFTRSRTGKGTGLGLTITHRIIEQHNGEIEATSPGPGQGSTFIVRLPLRPVEQAPPIEVRALPGLAA
jgi:signal transduction histidine kinase